MLSARLVLLIEGNSEEITRQVLDRVRRDERLPMFRQLPDTELLKRFGNVSKTLGTWLLEKEAEQLTRPFRKLGRERFKEGIPLHEGTLDPCHDDRTECTARPSPGPWLGDEKVRER